MSTTRIPPSSIEVMLYHYYCPQPHPNRQSQAYQVALKAFLKAGLLELHAEEGSTLAEDSGVRATAKGCAWVEMICRTPLPKEQTVYIDPRRNLSARALMDLLDGALDDTPEI